MADDMRRLLWYIVHHMVVDQAAKEAQRDATAVQDVPAEVSAIRDDAERDSDRLAPFFARGLRLAGKASGPLVVDDTTAEGNSIAEAFARFLVSSGLATSHSAPLEDGHFRYSFEVNWPTLRDVAHAAGFDLQQALSSEG